LLCIKNTSRRRRRRERPTGRQLGAKIGDPKAELPLPSTIAQTEIAADGEIDQPMVVTDLLVIA
jgi:hypothetical protein